MVSKETSNSGCQTLEALYSVGHHGFNLLAYYAAVLQVSLCKSAPSCLLYQLLFDSSCQLWESRQTTGHVSLRSQSLMQTHQLATSQRQLHCSNSNALVGRCLSRALIGQSFESQHHNMSHMMMPAPAALSAVYYCRLLTTATGGVWFAARQGCMVLLLLHQ